MHDEINFSKNGLKLKLRKKEMKRKNKLIDCGLRRRKSKYRRSQSDNDDECPSPELLFDAAENDFNQQNLTYEYAKVK